MISAAAVAALSCSALTGVDEFAVRGAAGGDATGTGGMAAGGAGGAGGGACDNRVLLFDGVDDVVEVLPAAAYSLPTFTLEMWIKPAMFDPAIEMRFVSYGQQGSAGYNLATSSFSDPPGRLFFRTYAAGVSQVFGDVPAAGSWSHIAGVYDGGELRIYQDGELKNTSVGSTAGFDGSFVVAATSGGNSLFFRGAIDEVRLSSVARYGQNSFAPEHRFADGDGDTVGLWHFDETAGTSARDAVNAHDGELRGPAGPQDGPQFVMDRCP